MKVLLLEDIEMLGYLGDVVEVKTGYARNYLLPQALATIPTDASVKSIAEEKAKRDEERKLLVDKMADAHKAVDGAEAVIAVKANEQGHLFGSVDEKQIAHNLREQGFEVTDDIVRMEGHIKEIGTHVVRVRYAEELVANVTVVVVSDDGVAEAAIAAAKAEEEANAPAPAEDTPKDEVPADVPAYDDEPVDEDKLSDEDKPTDTKQSGEPDVVSDTKQSGDTKRSEEPDVFSEPDVVSEQ